MSRRRSETDDLIGIDEDDDRGALSLLIDPEFVSTQEQKFLPTLTQYEKAQDDIFTPQIEHLTPIVVDVDGTEETALIPINTDQLDKPSPLDIKLDQLLLRDDELTYGKHNARVMKSGWIETEHDSFPDCECWLLACGRKTPDLSRIIVMRSPNPEPVTVADLKKF